MNSFGSFEFNALDNSGLNFCGYDIFPGHNFFCIKCCASWTGNNSRYTKRRKKLVTYKTFCFREVAVQLLVKPCALTLFEGFLAKFLHFQWRKHCNFVIYQNHNHSGDQRLLQHDYQNHFSALTHLPISKISCDAQ